MKSPAFFVLLSALVVCADKFNPILSKLKPSVIPNKFIIEVESTSSLNRRDDVVHPLDAIYHQFKSRDIDLQITKEFKMDEIFNGATVIVKNAEDVALIKNTPGVKAIRPVKIFSQARHEVQILVDSDSFPDTFSPHILGGVDKVHAEGNIGTGVKIGIIDSGIDYKHPFLGSNGIVIAYNFAGNDFDPGDPKPDPDPMDCTGHGTHVAGIIAAQPGNPYNISGVAYGATLGVYKVFGCSETTSEELVIEALQQGAKDGMDILTVSIGMDSGWSSSTAAIIADGIARNGTIITVATGNQGTSGFWCTSDPASGKEVIAIGSIDNTVTPLQNATVHGVDYPPIIYISSLPLDISGSLPIYATSTNTTVADDACSPLSKDTPDLSEYLVVIRRGACDFLDKLANAAAKGAKAMFIYDDGTGFGPIDPGNYTATLIRADDGEFLVKQFAGRAPINISFPQVGGFRDDHGGLMSDFSSYGPTFDFTFKPAFSTPGGNIISTYPVSMGSYAILSGTSMATPFAAGAAALLLAAKPKSLSALQNGTRTLFQTTSTKILVSKNDTGFDTLSKAGAGLINVYNAIHSTTVVSPGELILNDTAHFQGNHTIVIQNIGNTTKDYTLKHVPALTALTMKENSTLPSLGPVPLDPTSATVDMEPANFTVQAGASQQVAISVTLPTTLDPRRYPLYSGFIEVTSGSESYHVSYIGLGANLKDHQVFDNTTTVVNFPSPSILNPNGTAIDRPTNFTFDGENYPTMLWRLVMGTPVFRVDLLEPGIDVRVIGILVSSDYISRDSEASETKFHQIDFVEPCFMNMTKIPDGRYRIRFRALRITGDPTSEEDYESWVSPIIGVQTPSGKQFCKT